MATEADFRLPRTAIPVHYAITLEPDLDAAAFTGEVTVDLDVVERVGRLIVNAVDLEIAAVELDPGSAAALPGTVSHDPAKEQATLAFDHPVEPGRHTLRLSFTGALNDQLRGFYRSTYRDDAGAEQVLACSQFEATDARRAFPCWDEPDLKATFEVTLVVGEGLEAVSNSPVASEEQLGDGRRRIRFHRTMTMSTYLVAFVVGRLEATDPVDVDGVPLRVVTVPGKSGLAGFALDSGAFALRYFADYYGIPYPADKVDMIAIPDFAFGAMENLGAITFRETALLVDPARATQHELARVASVVAHELAHMWFGDLVTMRWWNGIWLNEAFATLMETKCVDAYRPDWKHWLGFGADRNASMDIDGLASTRPIEYPVASPEDANEMFDILTYEKGAAVLRMLELYLGEEVFRRGIHRYLSTHAYGNTETADLWAALEAESGVPVGEVMDTWILQGGHPRVTVARDGEGYTLSQEHFQYIGDSDRRWRVPVRFRSSSGEGRVLVEGDVTIPGGEGLVVNAGGQGCYRVAYEGDLAAAIAGRLRELEPEEQYALVADTLAGVLAGEVTAGRFLDLVGELDEATEPAVWEVAISGLGELDRAVSSDVRPSLQALVRSRVGPVVDHLGWAPESGDTDLRRRFRGSMLRTLGILGDDPSTVAEARHRFEPLLAGGEDVDGEVASAVLAVVAAHGDVADHGALVRGFEAARTPQDEDRFRVSLAAVPDQAAVDATMAMVLDGRIRGHDAGAVVARMIGVRETGPYAWDALERNWDEVLDRVPALTTRALLSQVHTRSEPDVAARIREWLAGHPVAGAQRYTAQQLERLAVRVRLRASRPTLD